MNSPRMPLVAATLVALAILGGPSAGAAPTANAAATLRARYASLAAKLEHSPFGTRLYLESAESPHALAGDVFAVVDYPVAAVAAAFSAAPNWCEALILHLNVKYCHPLARADGTALSVAIGRKYDQPLSEAFRVEFGYRLAAADSDYVAIELDAAHGPLGTTGFRITLEGVSLEAGRTFLHLRYSYEFGLQARLAMEAYLATAGSGKVGFTPIDAAGERGPRYVGGLRGAAERNTMRYYLAVDAYLAVGGAPSAERLEARLERWYAGTERYPRQLHEVSRDTYLEMKRREYARQQTLQ